MSEKGFFPAISNPWLLRSSLLHSHFTALTAVIFLSMLAIWTINGTNFIKICNSPQDFALIQPAVRNVSRSGWFSAELEPNFTSNLLALWKASGGDSPTADIAISGMEAPATVELSTGDVHELHIQALDEYDEFMLYSSTDSYMNML